VLSCRDVTERANALLDNDVSWSERMALRLHLAMCSMCRAYLDQLHKTRALLGRRTLGPPDSVTEDAVIALVTGHKGDKPP